MLQRLSLRKVKNLQSADYWTRRSRWLLWRFQTWRVAYEIRSYFRRTGEDASILATLLTSTGISFLLSIIGTGIILLCKLPQIDNSHIDNYDNLLVAIATIIGIFLSFYFTGLNTVIGGAYARSPRRVRDLIINERVNHFSVQYLVFLTLLCLELLAAGILLGARPAYAAFIVATLGCFAVLFFAELGRRAFFFFDPSLFAGQLRSEILINAESSSSRGFRFNSPEFQKYYRGRCESALQGFQGLIGLAKNESHLQETLVQIIREIQTTHLQYLAIKRRIPTKSQWFMPRAAYRDWFSTPEWLVHLATSTQTNLQPDSQPHHEWLEENLERLCTEAFQLALEQKNWPAVEVFASGAFQQFTELGHYGEIAPALQYFVNLQSCLEPFLAEHVTSPVKWSEDSTRYRIAMYQVSNSLLVTMVAGFFNWLDDLDISKLGKMISETDWKDHGAIYSLGLPFLMLAELETIRSGLIFEVESEGKVVSPAWYITELVFRRLAWFTQDAVDAVMKRGVALTATKVDHLLETNRSIEATILASDALELDAKVRILLDTAQAVSEKLAEEQSVEGLDWPKDSWEKYRQDLKQFREKLTIVQVSHLGALFTEDTSANAPDYFGKIVVLAGEECIRALDANNDALFSQLFPGYFDGILLTYNKFRKLSRQLNAEAFLLLLSDPIIDLMDVSGHALIYAQLHGNPGLYQPCIDVWKETIGQEGNQFLGTLALLSRHKKKSIFISNHDSSRARWSSLLAARLRSLPRAYRRAGNPSWATQRVEHPSKLIRILAGSGEFSMLMYEAHDVFADLALSHLPEAEGLNFGLPNKISDFLSDEDIA